MATDWIKMRGSLLTNPKVIRMARALLRSAEFRAWFGLLPVVAGASDDHVTRHVTHRDASTVGVTAEDARLIPVVTRVTVGALVPLWIGANECASDEAVLRDAGMFEIDTIAGVPGFGRALESVGWIEQLPNDGGIRFSNFHEYNTVGRQRSSGAMSDAERAKKSRDKKKQEGVTNRHVTDGVTGPVTRHPREEEKREEKNTLPLPPQTGRGASEPISSPTKAGAICKAIRGKGISDVNPSHPELLALIAKGVTVEVFEAAASKSAEKKKGMAYLIAIVQGQLERANEIAAGVGVVVPAWDTDRATIQAKAKELGMSPWDEFDIRVDRESFAAYTERVRRRIDQSVQA